MTKILILIHILAGSIALLAAPVALALKGGSQGHRSWGKVYFWSMTFIFISGVLLATIKWIPFLFMVAVFSYYSLVSGYRWLYLKNVGFGQKPMLIDWLALAVAVIFNLLFIGWGITQILSATMGFYAYLAVGFGVGGLILALNNLRRFINNKDRGQWLFQHIGGMMGSYLATLTAFSSQVMHFMPEVWRWLWPSLIGVPLIFYLISREKKKSVIT